MTTRIGQIVHYVLSPEDVDYIGMQGTGLGVRGPVTAGQIVAGIVTHVYGVQDIGEAGSPSGITRTAVNLQVVLDGERNIWKQDPPEGTLNGCWYTPAADAPTVDLAGFYAAQVQPVINALQDQINQLQTAVKALTPAPATPPTPATPPAPDAPVA